MAKLKTHKGLLKRVCITAGGKVKFKRAFSSHLRSHKSGDKIRQLRSKRLVKAGDLGRLRNMLHCPLTAGDRGTQTSR